MIWRSKIVYCIGPIALTVTLSLCSTHSSFSESDVLGFPSVLGTIGTYTAPSVDTDYITLLAAGVHPLIVAATVLSFATNVVATSLIAYKAW